MNVKNYSFLLSNIFLAAGLSIIPITWSHLTEMNLVVEIIIGLIVTVFYCVGVAYITVASGPGKMNIFF
jgi:hypothetical protein